MTGAGQLTGQHPPRPEVALQAGEAFVEALSGRVGGHFWVEGGAEQEVRPAASLTTNPNLCE